MALVAPPSVSACTAQVDDAQEPPFIRQCFGTFDRASAIAIAIAEWRAWGQVVYDGDPNTEGPVDPDTKAERQPGFWQRVGLYWWLGMNESDPSAGWTGEHDAAGDVFDAGDDGYYAWSAAFISFVMRLAGAGPSFPYSESHSVYIDAAFEETQNRFTGHCGIVVAKQPDQISMIGGNVQDAVALTHVPVTDQGMLATADGTVLDTRYPWLVVIRVAYNQ